MTLKYILTKSIMGVIAIGKMTKEKYWLLIKYLKEKQGNLCKFLCTLVHFSKLNCSKIIKNKFWWYI